MADRTIDLVRAYEESFGERLKMTAGENAMSADVRHVLSSQLAGRYATFARGELSEAWPYPNNELSTKIITKSHELASKIFKGKHADARPASGIQATRIILTSLLEKGSAFLSLALDAGAHFTTDKIARDMGYQRLDIPYDFKTGEIDFRQTTDLILRHQAKLIFLDPSMIAFPIPLRNLRDAVGPEIIISYDASHVLGLIAGGQFQSPLEEGADFLHGGTHKTLAGPEGGIIIASKSIDDHEPTKRIFERITQFVVNYKPAQIAALGIALEEYEEFGGEYAETIVKNGQLLGQILTQRGLKIAFADRSYTRSHQVFLILGCKEEAEHGFQLLQQANIDVNPTRIPFANDTYGLRVGLSEITRRGIKERALIQVSHIIADALEQKEPIVNLRNKVINISKQYPDALYTLPTSSPDNITPGKSADLS